MAGSKSVGPPGAAAHYERTARTQAQYEAYISILKAAEEMSRDFVSLLKAHGLSLAQFNVLRILRGAGDRGLACHEVAERLIRHDPDITRLFDRLEQRKLVARTRDPGDRRVVRTRISGAGLELLDRLDQPVDALHEKQLGHMSERQLEELRVKVEEARTR